MISRLNVTVIYSEPIECRVYFSVTDPDPDPGSYAFLTPGSGIGFFPDPGSRIPNHIFESL
jgi:hypothetical protein